MVSTATAASLLDAEAFNQLVLEKGLQTWMTGGYLYAGFHGPNGWELYRTYAGPWDEVAPEIVTSADPAAGANPGSITVPTGYRYFVYAIFYKVVNDANVADRSLSVSITDGTNTWMAYGFGTLTASQTGTLRLVPGVTADTTGTDQSIAIPTPMELPAGWVVSGSYANKQAGDNFEVTRMLVKVKPA